MKITTIKGVSFNLFEKVETTQKGRHIWDIFSIVTEDGLTDSIGITISSRIKAGDAPST